MSHCYNRPPSLALLQCPTLILEVNSNDAGGLPGALLEEELTSLCSQLAALSDVGQCKGATAQAAPKAHECTAHIQGLVDSVFLNVCTALARAQVLVFYLLPVA